MEADCEELNEEAIGYRYLLDINWTDIAENLIKSRLLLTALELHTELIENGRELAILRDFFSNPGNFEKEAIINARDPSPLPFSLARTSSNLTLDSIDDFTRYSDDGFGEKIDERIAVLQFELRKAQETIKSLRGSLTEATDHESSQKSTNESDTPNEESIKPHEKRALNFLVNEYLLQHGYRLTSVTLSDENEDQDFDDWDDVGLNIPKPPNLLKLYRDFDKHAMPLAAINLAKVQEQKDKLELVCDQLKTDVMRIEKESKNKDDLIELLQTNLNEEKEINKKCYSEVNMLTEELHKLRQEHDKIIKSKKDIETTTTNTQCVSVQHDKSIDSGVEVAESIQTGSPVIEQQSMCIEDKDVDSTTEETVAVTTVIEEKTEQNIDGHQNNVKTASKRNVPASFKKALVDVAMVHDDTRVGNEVTRLATTEESVVLLVARSLPHIVPNVLLNKREELLPIILCTAINHPHEKERDNLLHLLVNLIKRPNEDQRCVIINGCSAFANCVGHVRTEAELLPQLWEQISHKFPERRQLVAEACAVLAEHLPVEIVSSLLLSMLKQMYTEDRNDVVRATVIKSLALVLTTVDNANKYKEAEQLLIESLCDMSEDVREATTKVLLPSLLAWACELDIIQSDLLELFLTQLETILADFMHMQEAKQDEDPEEMVSAVAVISRRFLLFLEALTLSVPALMADILSRAPFEQESNDEEEENDESIDNRLHNPTSPLTDLKILFTHPQKLNYYLKTFDVWLEKEETKTFWESLSWVINKFVTRIYSILGRIHYIQVDWIEGFSQFFRCLCLTFGRVYTINRLKVFFETELKAVFTDCEDSVSDDEKEHILCSSIIPIFCLGVLTVFNEEDDKTNLKLFLKESLVQLASQQKDVRSFDYVCEKLSSNTTWCEVLFEALWDILTHSHPSVRSIVPHILQTMIKNLEKTAIMKRVLPALVTLSTDNDKSVRISTVPAFGAIVEHISDDEMLEKIHIQFQSFLSDPSYYDQHELQVALIRTFGKIGPHSEPRFRDDFLHPKLTELVLRNNSVEDENKKSEVAVALLEAYASLTCCFISKDILRNHTLPGLLYLKKDLEIVAPEYEESVSVLMKDCEDKLVNQTTTGQTSTTSTVQEDVKRVLMNKFNRLKEVSHKPKMDLFRKKYRRDSEKS